MRGKTLRRALLALGVAGSLAAAGGAVAEPNPNFPNLPATNGISGWFSAGASTLGYVTPARQWVRMPNVLLAADTYILSVTPTNHGQCVSAGFTDAQCTLPPEAPSGQAVQGWAYPFDEADPVTHSRFDTFPDVVVQTVAFGAIPVQATLTLSLPHDGVGLPKPLRITDYTMAQYQVGTGPFPDWRPPAGSGTTVYEVYSDTTVTGELSVRLTHLSVDGQPVAVGSDCDAAAVLHGRGKGYDNRGLNSAADVPAGSYSPVQGGDLSGTLDVGRFSNCGANGDDLAPIVSVLGSGDGFPVKMHQALLTKCFDPDRMVVRLDTCNAGTPLPIPTTAPGS